MTMYMDGFSFSLFSQKGCLNLFVSSFTLNTRFKFFLAMTGVMCLGISVEGLSFLKRRYIIGLKKKMNRHANSTNNNAAAAADDDDDKFRNAKLILAGFQGLQALVGYVLMLSAMTYSVELLLSAVVGLALGFHIFERHKTLLSAPLESFEDGDGTPCCATEEELMNSDTQTNFDYVPVSESDNEENSSLYLRRTNENSGVNSND
jgi:hypothetical protein